MSTWGEVFLGIIAFSTLVTAAFNVGVLFAGLRALRRVNAFIDQAERRLEPTFAHVDKLGETVSQVAGSTLRQLGRVERLLDQLGEEIDRTGNTVRSVITAPSRQGNAVLAGARAIVQRLRRGVRELAPASREETPGPLIH